eukprot:jgi/Picsp_1/5713/NSC_03072-R1_acyl- n-acyltransferase with ring fyve phd-type zinc finger protein
MGRRGRTGLVELLFSGNYAEPGDVVRYIDRQNRTLLVGRIYEGGIQVPGEDGLLTLTAFEIKAGVCYRRPAEHIYLQDGRSIMECQKEMCLRKEKSCVNGTVLCKDGDGGCGKASDGSRLMDEGMLLKDSNDDYCVYCGLGGDLVCCETCPTTAHAQCIGIEANTDKAWYCAGCLCCVCNEPMFESVEDTCPCVYYGEADHVEGSVPYVDILEQGYEPVVLMRPGAEPVENAAGTGVKREYSSVEKGDQETAARPFSISNNSVINIYNIKKEDAAGSSVNAESFDEVRSMGGYRAHRPCVANCSEMIEKKSTWYFSSKCETLSLKLANMCCKGAIPVGEYCDKTKMSMQLIRSAAVRGDEWSGKGPKYSVEQKKSLRKILSAAYIILETCYDKVVDSRTGEDLIPKLVQGVRYPTFEDYSGTHVAVLFANSVVVSAAVVQLLGDDSAEIPLLATRPDVQGSGAGTTLLSQLEHKLNECGISKIFLPGMYGNLSPYMLSRHPPGVPVPSPNQSKYGYSSVEKSGTDELLAGRGLKFPGVTMVCKKAEPFVHGQGGNGFLNMGRKKFKLNARANVLPLIEAGMIKPLDTKMLDDTVSDREISTSLLEQKESASLPSTNTINESNSTSHVNFRGLEIVDKIQDRRMEVEVKQTCTLQGHPILMSVGAVQQGTHFAPRIAANHMPSFVNAVSSTIQIPSSLSVSRPVIFSGVPISEPIPFKAPSGLPSVQINNNPMVPDNNDNTDNK